MTNVDLTGIKIRRAEVQDLPAITAIYNQAISAGFQTAHTVFFTEAERKDWLDSHNDKYPLFVAIENSEVVGYIGVSPYRSGRQALRNTAEVSFYIAGEWQGKGIGKELLKFAEEKGAGSGFKTFIAIVLDRNKASIQLLLKSGYTQWGELPGVADFDGVECGHLYLGKSL